MATKAPTANAVERDPATDRDRNGALAALSRYFEVSLYLLLATSVATLVTTGKLDALSTIVPPVALTIKAWRYWRGYGPEISPRAAYWLTIGYFLIFPVDLLLFSRALAAGAPNPGLFAALLAAIHLMLFALVVRLYSAATTRDYLFLALLAFACMLVAAILTVDTTFLALFLTFLVLAVSTFVGLEVRRSAEGAVTPPLARGTPAARRLARVLGYTSATVAVASLALGTAIFFVIPRFTTGYLRNYNLQPGLISGFDDDVELGRIGTIKLSGEVVMRVRSGESAARMQSLRWRGIALTNFDGRRWFNPPMPQETRTADIGASYWVLTGSGQEQSTVLNRRERRVGRFTVLLEPIASEALFAPAVAVRIFGTFASQPQSAWRPARGSYLLVDRTGSIFNPYQNISKLRYDVISAIPDVPPRMLREAGAAYPAGVTSVYLQLPDLDRRVPELAREITRNAANEYDRALAIETYLKTRFGYTLELRSVPEGRDALAYFLFERRAGHCEYFASAMTVMVRSLGIPARLVNGFLPGEYNDVAEDWIIRGSDAHSWVEVYFPGHGWITFDPTPPADPPLRGFWGRLVFYYDWFQLMWSEWVVNYDFSRQTTFAQNVQKAAKDWSRDSSKFLAAKHQAAIDFMRDVDYALRHMTLREKITLLLLLAALVAFVRSRRMRDRLADALARIGLEPEESAARRATALYRRMLRALARHGWRRGEAQTPREFAASLPPGAHSAPVARLTQIYESARFGARPEAVPQMTDLLAEIHTALKS